MSRHECWLQRSVELRLSPSTTATHCRALLHEFARSRRCVACGHVGLPMGTKPAHLQSWMQVSSLGSRSRALGCVSRRADRWRSRRLAARRPPRRSASTRVSRSCRPAVSAAPAPCAARSPRGDARASRAEPVGVGARCRRPDTPSQSQPRPLSVSTGRRHPGLGGSRCARRACRVRLVCVRGVRSPLR
jgi:hypothetical protein